MEESTRHEMVVYLSQRFSSICYVVFFCCCCFLHISISSQYDFHDDAERMIVKVKTREM